MGNNITDHQAKYFAHLLTRKTSSSDREKLMGVVLDAQVEPKPHQIDAALFAFRSPFSKGEILADEVGLGKTIEAGIVLSQYWSEHKRKLLIIAPANLRQQWSGELRDKFFLDSEILDSKKVNEKLEKHEQIFQNNKVYIVSYDFARRFSELLSSNKWDLLVIDEAHRLRNVYKQDNITSNTIKNAFENTPKLLLTATPLQNSLLELYGLVSIIDKNFFGDFSAFKEEYVTGLGTGKKAAKKLQELQYRLKPIVNRALRNQVGEYINYTERKSLTQTFLQSEQEVELYDQVTEYLGRDELYAFTSSQRTLTTLLMLKLLGSSSHAIAVTLERLATRVEEEAKEGVRRDGRGHKIFDEDLINAIDEDIDNDLDADLSTDPSKLSPQEISGMLQEASELKEMAKLARSIVNESKASALLKALDTGFAELPKLNAAQKAIIFTESTRTQSYLVEVLEKNGYKEKVVAFNGTGGGESGKKIYSDWLKKHQGSDIISGVKTADRRASIVEYFKDDAQIMVATEAAGEGINLQFCSMVINYDLPWNPQRVEQRIGRCHRYGQKSDVIVMNFLNENNKAEQRILELLRDKFQLFSGVFGASDQILGAIESGFDFERMIGDIIRTCRTTEQIEKSFNKLQEDLSEKIEKQMTATRRALMDNLDTEVQEKLRVSRDESSQYLSRYQEWLWTITKHNLQSTAIFNETDHTFNLQTTPLATIKTGKYRFQSESEGITYRLQHPLAEHIINTKKKKKTPPAEIIFDYTGSQKTAKALEKHINNYGTLHIFRYSLNSKAQTEEHFIPVCKTNTGELIDAELVNRMLELPTCAIATISDLESVSQSELTQIKNKYRAKTKKRDKEYLKEESTKLDAWAADMRRAAKSKMTKLDNDIRELRKKVRTAEDIEEQLAVRQQLRKLEKRRDEHEFNYRLKIREIDEKTDALLDTIENSLKATESLDEIFSITWRLA